MLSNNIRSITRLCHVNRSCIVKCRFGSIAPESRFELDKGFVSEYATKKTSFGFNGLGELVFLRSYSRPMADGRREQWHDTVERVVNGTFRMQQDWAALSGLPYDAVAQQRLAQNMFDRMFCMKFLPPGRGLWAMGSDLTEKKRLFAALNNCAFVSTEVGGGDVCQPFSFLMDASMLGVGVGFDTKGAGAVLVRAPLKAGDRDIDGATSHYVIPDSREGWVESVRLLLAAFLVPADAALVATSVPVVPTFDYSLIRPAGAPIRGFGGTSQGPAILRELHCSLEGLLRQRQGAALSSTTIVDIMNMIGRCVVAGNVRRTAEIAFGSPADSAYTALKDYKANPHRVGFGWTSNNSVFAPLGMDYGPLCTSHVAGHGEPGFAWLENMQAYSRMDGPRDYIDAKARGGNPCLEQTLESFEVCCLVETFPHRHESLQDFKETLAVAMLYAKTVTLGATHWPETNAVMLRNRRIGCSMAGVAQFLAARGHAALKQWCEEGYVAVRAADAELSDRFAVPRSIKVTSIKPSGTVSLLAGATPGMHFPESRHYLRRVRLPAGSSLVAALRARGYLVEPDVTAPATTAVVEIPVDLLGPSPDGASTATATATTRATAVKTLDEVTCWEQLALAAFLQRYWADNQVSCTVTFDPLVEGGQLAAALDYYQFQLKGVSFLPRVNQTMRRLLTGVGGGSGSGGGGVVTGAGSDGGYAQMPYEAISQERYTRYEERLRSHQVGQTQSLSALYCDANVEKSGGDTIITVPDQFCDSSSCVRDV